MRGRLLRWPLPALLGWGVAWGLFFLLRAQAVSVPIALSGATLAGLVFAAAGDTPWRRVFIGAGFPLSALLLMLSAGQTGAAGSLPAWTWLAPLALLVLLYPINAWRDAPLFPTPEGALRGLAARVPLPAQALVMDAGCGLGAGLAALRQEYPQVRLIGLEWSWPLVLACRWRCRDARIRRQSIWRADWSGCSLVYLFQRPESMERAADKAAAELPAGAWLASLEFPLPGIEPTARLESVPGKPLWLYRMPLRPARDVPAG